MQPDRRETPGSRFRDYLDWAFKGLVTALVSGAIAIAAWGFDAEHRLDNLEKLDGRVAKVEGREESYQELRTEIAVLKTKLDSQSATLDRLVRMLERQ